MLLASLALALLAFPQASYPQSAVKESKGDEAPKVWDNLGVMRRMLTHQIGAKRDKITSFPAPKSEDGDAAHADGAKGADGDETVANAWLSARDYTQIEGVINADSEYVPGLAAVFSLTVPVRVQLVDSEPGKDEARKPSETKNSDDEAWDRLARGDEVSSDPLRFLRDFNTGKGGKSAAQPHHELRFEDAAVKTLKETLFDTLARFGSKLGCAHGERVVVVARLTAGAVVNAPSGKGDDAPVTKVSVSDNLWRSQRFGPSGSSSSYVVMNGSGPSRRIVIQVSADDLRAFKSGDLERDELLKKTRIEEFNVNATPSGFTYTTPSTAAR
jgi:hypothetical protein